MSQTMQKNKKLYVGSLPYSMDETELQNVFSAFGTVESARIITDKFTGQSKGFGFVEMASDSEAQAAIEGVNGKTFGGRTLVVNEARPEERKERSFNSGGGGDRGWGGGGGGRHHQGGDRGSRR